MKSGHADHGQIYSPRIQQGGGIRGFEIIEALYFSLSRYYPPCPTELLHDVDHEHADQVYHGEEEDEHGTFGRDYETREQGNDETLNEEYAEATTREERYDFTPPRSHLLTLFTSKKIAAEAT